MNKKLLATALLGLGLFPSLLFGQYYRLDIDLQNPGENLVIDRVFTGNTVGLDVGFWDGDSHFAVTNWSMFFKYTDGQYSTNDMDLIQGTTSSNRVVFDSTTNIFYSASENYYFSIFGVDGIGRRRTFARGRLIEEYDPAASASLGVSTGGVYIVPWGGIYGDPASSASLVAYVTGLIGDGEEPLWNAASNSVWYRSQAVTNAEDTIARAGVVSNAAVAAAALPSSGSGKMSGDLDFGGNLATNMADMWGIGGPSRGRISFEDSLLENFTIISADNASLGNLVVRGGRVLLESTLWQMNGDNASAYTNPIQSMPVTLSTNGAWVETSHPAGGVTRLLITTTNGPHRSSGAIDVEVGGEVVYSFTPTCSGDVQQVDFPFAYASPGEGMILTLRTVPEVLTNAPPTITALQLYTMADTNQVGRRIDTANAVYEGDSPTLPRQWANKTYVDSAADAAMDLANGETWDRTHDTDLNGHDLRRNARFVETTFSNSYAMLYGGGAVVEIDGEGSRVVPEIIGFEVEAGETATLTVYSYSGGATNLLPEVSTNLDTWTRLDASAIVSATNTDEYTARVVFTNADATAVFVRLVDVSGGEGVPVTKFTGGVNIGGVTRTSWPGNGTGATQLIANISGQAAKTSTYDEATATLTITDLPDNNSGGGTASGAVESPFITIAWSTNITLLGGTNLAGQAIASIGGTTVINLPVLSSTNNSAFGHFTVPARTTNTVLFNTNGVSGFVPSFSTTATAYFCWFTPPGTTNRYVRRFF